MKRLIRLFAVVLVIAALGTVGVIVAAQSGGGQTADREQDILEETTAEISDLSVIVSATGLLSPERQVPLVFELVAPVAEILVEEGQTVTAGQPLARLNTNDFETSLRDAELALQGVQVAFDALTAEPREEDIAAAQAALTAAQAQAAAAYSTSSTAQQVEIARLQAELARNQLWQTQLSGGAAGSQQFLVLPQIDPSTLPGGTPPEVIDAVDQYNQFAAQSSVPQEYIDAQNAATFNQLDSNVQIADANYAATANQGPDVGALAAANAQIVQAQITLNRLINGPDATELALAQIDLQTAQLALQQAQALLDRAVLRAPFDGVVATNNLVVGENPPTESYAILMMDTSGYYVDVAIDETDIIRVQNGQPATIFLDALPDAEVTGRVTRVAVTPTVVGQVVTYLVRVTLDPNDAPVRVGMSATARITVNYLEDVLVLRNRFIRIDRTTGDAFVTVVNDAGEFAEIPVELGLRNEQQSQILSGLQPGQRVVLVPRSTFNPVSR